jgi:hypothetical protein
LVSKESERQVVGNLKSKFGTGGVDFIEEHLLSTGAAGGVGLVTNREFKERRDRIELTIAEEEERLVKSELGGAADKKESKKRGATENKAVALALLSFQDEEE